MNKLLKLAEQLKANSEVSIKAKEMWSPLAAQNLSDINILGEIGDDWESSDTTFERVNRKLDMAAGADVVVNINSFGGSMFEGVAIYNALRQYSGKVTTKIMGIAASAASLIALAGDDIYMAESSFLMIHNAWVFTYGNKDELRETANKLEQFDNAMADIYALRMDMKKDEIIKMMNEESYIGGTQAIEMGIATSLFENTELTLEEDGVIAAHKVDLLLAKQGLPRSKRRELLADIKKGTRNAAQSSTHDAAQRSELANGIADLLKAFKS